jgi:hypothetical protein
MVQEDNNLNSKKENSKRKRITSDYKNDQYISHIYWKIKKIYPEVDQKTIVKIISRYFELTQEDLSFGNTIQLGVHLGDLYVVKIKREVHMNEKGDLINNLPVDQKATNALWAQKPELRGKKFVRHMNNHSSGFLFKLKHYTFSSNLKNKSIYNFKFSRTLKGKLSNNIKNKEVQAYEIQNKNE